MSDSAFYAATPKPPYYAVIFTATRSANTDGYAQMGEAIYALALKQSGYLGIEVVGDQQEITVSYWKDEASILAWKQVAEHLLAQKLGQERWLESYRIRVAKVERDYAWER